MKSLLQYGPPQDTAAWLALVLAALLAAVTTWRPSFWQRARQPKLPMLWAGGLAVIAAILTERYEVDLATARHDVQATTEKLIKLGILEAR